MATVVDKSPKLAIFSLIGVAFMACGLGFAMLVPFFRYHHSHAAQNEEKGQTDKLKTPFWYLYTACQYLSVFAFVAALIYLVINALPVVEQMPVK